MRVKQDKKVSIYAPFTLLDPQGQPSKQEAPIVAPCVPLRKVLARPSGSTKIDTAYLQGFSPCLTLSLLPL